MVQFSILLIAYTGLVTRKSLVLLKDRHQRPPLQVAETRHNGAGAMLAFIAVDQQWQISCVSDGAENAMHQWLGDVVERLFIALRWKP